MAAKTDMNLDFGRDEKISNSIACSVVGFGRLTHAEFDLVNLRKHYFQHLKNYELNNVLCVRSLTQTVRRA